MDRLPILAVDLDRTLIDGNILHEAAWEYASRNIWGFLQALVLLLLGRAQFKAHLSRCVTVDPARLAYNPEVLDYIRDWRAQGGKAALVTATDQHVAKAIADHLGLFDEAHGSDGTHNLKGNRKAGFLVQRYGAGAYDYIGDAHADLPVWNSARKAITVGLSPMERNQVHSLGGEVVHLPGTRKDIGPYIKALRPHQWAKNVLVFLPLIASHETSPSMWFNGVAAFICFSLVASSVYVLNDLLDLSADRIHPRKCKRPLASGALPIEHGTWMVPALLLGGCLFGLLVQSLAFFGVIALYYLLTLAYSLSLKRKLIIDICTLAGLYTLRIFAGGTAAGLPISEWLLAFSIFFFFSLAAVKRQGELVDTAHSGHTKVAGRGYECDDRLIVSMMAVSSGYVADLVLALYLDSPTVRQLYAHPVYLWGICPILLYWISRMVMTAHRGWMDDDPIVFAMKDPVSRYCGVIVCLVITAGVV
ncbi:UbiA family prenyltransferase [Aquamicrobium terrae]|uniref:4-hydroxybenzoate polyprenyltransferase/phosphoglycolate phosphatase-like HAD superfamily hydrolase n=1 Tax=Aquamicrobium terrae TaxID=1324945 RepID=A0ABV2MY12_9HYPH